MLAVKRVGSTVGERLAQLGIATLRDLAAKDAESACAAVSMLVANTCWKNSPRARSDIAAAQWAAKPSGIDFAPPFAALNWIVQLSRFRRPARHGDGPLGVLQAALHLQRVCSLAKGSL
ncbi:MAG TPA: hypothetical protein VK446_16495 [Methylocystis sp.]|nr:hypothetical protein [Methylocystis sp.]